MKNFNLLGSLVSIFILVGCSSAPKKSKPVEAAPVAAKINYEDVQNRLGLDIPPGQTGFREKTFDACDLGPALDTLNPPLKDCHHAVFTLVQYQLSCRETEDSSVILTESDLYPVSNQKLKWTLGPKVGETRTNERGEGALRAITSASQKRTHLRLSTGIDFLMVRVNEVTSIVTPPSWCGIK